MVMSAVPAAGSDAHDSAEAAAVQLLQAHVIFEKVVPTKWLPTEEVNQSAQLLELAGLAAVRLQQSLGLCDEDASVPGKTCICLPTWALIAITALVVVVVFYLVNFYLWSRRRRLHRLHNLEATKELSDHGNLLGNLVENFVEKFDQSFLGVDTDFGAVKVIVHEGVVEVHDLTIYNPPGYWSDYFLHVGRTLVDIDMATYIASFGNHVVIEKVQLQDVDVVWERGVFASNLLDMERCTREGEASDSNSQASGSEDAGIKVSLQKVEVEGVTLKFASYLLAGCGPRAVAPDIYYENFEEESDFGASIIPMLFLSLVASVLTSLMGRQASQIILKGTSGLVSAATDAICHLVALLVWSLESVFCRCCRGRAESTAERVRKSASAKEAAKTPGSATARGLRPWLCGWFSSPCLPCQSVLQSGRPAVGSGSS